MADNNIRANQPVNTSGHPQVYYATHTGEGNALPFMNRSFISFTYGGKKIEDFGLIAVIDGDRMQKDGYTAFNDIVSTYDVLDGQFYWGSHYGPTELNFVLATDGITQRDLEQFLYWFKPGVERELVLAEHPYRAIMARVAAAPALSVLPFEEKGVDVVIAGQPAGTYTTSTTLYRGEINLSLVADDPHWYSKNGLFGSSAIITVLGDTLYAYLSGNYAESGSTFLQILNDALHSTMPNMNVSQNQLVISPTTIISGWEGANGQIQDYLSDKDALKVILEDGVPISDMINIRENLILAGGITVGKPSVTYDEQQSSAENAAAVENDYGTVVLDQPQEQSEQPQDGQEVSQEQTSQQGEQPQQNQETLQPEPIVITFDGFSLGAGQQGYLYYPGNAPSPTILTFSCAPVVPTSGNYVAAPYYISFPSNSYNNNNNKRYNSIILTSENSYSFDFTTPSAWTAYNQAVNIFTTLAADNAAYTDARIALRDGINHSAARAWAIAVIDEIDQNNEGEVFTKLLAACVRMMQFIGDIETSLNNGQRQYIFTPFSSTFSFNAKTGENKGAIKYRKMTIPRDDNDDYWEHTLFTKQPIVVQEQDIGDMVRSNYLTLKERNYLDANGMISRWQASAPTNTHIITHDCPVALDNFKINFKNMYL